jgi:hypothetical protein
MQKKYEFNCKDDSKSINYLPCFAVADANGSQDMIRGQILSPWLEDIVDSGIGLSQ